VSAKATEDESHRKLFLLQVVQPDWQGWMDGSSRRLAPIFAAAFASHKSWKPSWSAWRLDWRRHFDGVFRGAFRRRSLTGRGSPWLRGGVTGLMTTAGGIRAYFAFPDWQFRVAMLVAVIVVAVELGVISYIRHRYMDTPFLQASFQVIVGGVLVFLDGMAELAARRQMIQVARTSVLRAANQPSRQENQNAADNHLEGTPARTACPCSDDECS